ncbi:Pyridoxine/pyridoxamine 5'-phosphate oxidase [Colletotrichum viniferum]|nr:Pyridoxine/pyridoxamine 5'-phosphate oxidase [Colletotrichum viniferum]
MADNEENPIRTQLRDLKVLQGCPEKCGFTTFPASPQEAFTRWLQEAVEAGVKEPHAMTLSTVDAQGCPDARVLILKNVDHRGWHFAIKADSPKGHQLSSNGHAALTFYWPDQGRQIRVRGKAYPLPVDESRRDFADRPSSSKVSALASKQSQVLRDENQLLQALDVARRTVEENPGLFLPGWTVYTVDPTTVEFWQGTQSRLHQRLSYSFEAEEGTWVKQTLWP